MPARLSVVVPMALAVLSSVARADQRRDYALEGEQPGQHLILDYYGTGGQVTLEQRGFIYGKANSYTFNVASLIGYPLGQVTASAALRFLFLELGGTIGYRAIWRNLSFQPGDGTYCKDCDRSARRRLDPVFGSGPDSDRFGFAEARAQLYAPLNDYFVFTSLVAARYEGVRPRSYDWFFTDIHDAGLMGRWEAFAFVKHRDWGAIGPYVQLMVLPRAGHHESEWAFGFNALTRLGLVDRNDLLFVTFLMRPGDGYYGQASYFAPIRALIVYRMTLNL